MPRFVFFFLVASFIAGVAIFVRRASITEDSPGDVTSATLSQEIEVEPARTRTPVAPLDVVRKRVPFAPDVTAKSERARQPDVARREAMMARANRDGFSTALRSAHPNASDEEIAAMVRNSKFTNQSVPKGYRSTAARNLRGSCLETLTSVGIPLTLTISREGKVVDILGLPDARRKEVVALLSQCEFESPSAEVSGELGVWTVVMPATSR